MPDSYLRELVAYWRDRYDWRKAEAAINAYEHYQVSVAGVPAHFTRKPGRGPRPIPLILSHGWPWTFWHWSKVIDPLADPATFGGDPAGHAVLLGDALAPVRPHTACRANNRIETSRGTCRRVAPTPHPRPPTSPAP